MTKRDGEINWTNVLQWTNVGLAACFGICIYLDRTIEGFGIFFTLMGLVLILGTILNTGTLVFTIGGFYDLIKNPTYKRYYARFINLSWGLLLVAFGTTALFKIFG